jgi:hypothetical protein
MFVCRAFYHIVTTMTLDSIVAFYIIVAFVIPLVALLTSSLVVWRKECFFGISVYFKEYTFPVLFNDVVSSTVII